MGLFQEIDIRKGKVNNLPISITYSLFDPIPYEYREHVKLENNIYVEFEKAREHVRFFLSTILGEIPFMTNYGNIIHTLFLENFKSIGEVTNVFTQELKKGILSSIKDIEFISLVPVREESNLDKNIIILSLKLRHTKSERNFSLTLNLKNNPYTIDSEDLKIYDVVHM